jgi:hypothetical protein
MIRGCIALACVSIAGCALELDYGPPTPLGHDAGRIDGGGLDGSAHDAARDANRDGTITSGACDAGCDDGLRCTADHCASGLCMHGDLCPTGTDCIARNGGECRRPCTSAADCDDGISCTTDVCDATDMHCAHASTCPTGQPVCLDNGVCVPAHCTTDAECSDGNACNGLESCVSTVCHAGTAVTCPTSSGCESIACDATTGACVTHLDSTMCDDGRGCTIDTCGTGGSCLHAPSDGLCATANHCISRSCQPTATSDPTGCVDTGATACSSSPCGTPQCDPTTGGCNPDSLCAAGQVCSATGCQAPNICTTDAGCTTIHSSTGCATFCRGGACLPRMCTPLPTGSCGELIVDASGCPANGMCNYQANSALCMDGDPLSTDTCDPVTFTCTHTCPSTTNGCATYSYNGTMCVQQLSPTFCSAAHALPTQSDCAAWICVGANGGPDGCMPVPSNAACDDHASCTDDVCTLQPDRMGQCSNPPTATATLVCDDGLACTQDACDPTQTTALTGCTHTPDDNVCTSGIAGLDCATPYCAQIPATARVGPLPTGCALRYDTTHCSNGAICPTDGHCALIACSAGASCDDGNPCNGTESCDGATMHCVQSPTATTVCPTVGTCASVCTPSGCVVPQTMTCSVATGP